MSDSERVVVRVTEQDLADIEADVERRGYSTKSEFVYHILNHRTGFIKEADDFGHPEPDPGGELSEKLWLNLDPDEHDTLEGEADEHEFPTLTHYLRALIRRREQILGPPPEEMQALRERVDELEETVETLKDFVEAKNNVDLDEWDVQN